MAGVKLGNYNKCCVCGKPARNAIANYCETHTKNRKEKAKSGRPRKGPSFSW